MLMARLSMPRLSCEGEDGGGGGGERAARQQGSGLGCGLRAGGYQRASCVLRESCRQRLVRHAPTHTHPTRKNPHCTPPPRMLTLPIMHSPHGQ